MEAQRIELPDSEAPTRGLRLFWEGGLSVFVGRRPQRPFWGVYRLSCSFATFQAGRLVLAIGWKVKLPLGTVVFLPDTVNMQAPRSNIPGHEWRTSRSAWECRRQLVTVELCPDCGKPVEMWAETDYWDTDPRSIHRWEHRHFGPAYGLCCGLMFIEGIAGAKTRIVDLSDYKARREAIKAEHRRKKGGAR